MRGQVLLPHRKISRSGDREAFSVLEMLVSAAVMTLILVCLAGIINMASSSYKRTMGKLDSFEVARAAFDTMGRTLRQATLQSYLGYDNPLTPANYTLKSDLHFISGRARDLGLTGSGVENSHAVFFQAPLGTAETSSLRSANMLLASTGFFIGYGPDPMIPAVLDERVENRRRFRLFQFIEPRESMSVYERTITLNGVPTSNESYRGSDWFSQAVNAGQWIHPLADNVIALVIQPVYEGDSWDTYHWNSRDLHVSETRHRLPQALKVLMAVIDERGAAQLGNTEAPPNLLPPDLFEPPNRFEDLVSKLERALSDRHLNYRIFQTTISLDAANTHL